MTKEAFHTPHGDLDRGLSAPVMRDPEAFHTPHGDLDHTEAHALALDI